MQRSEGSSQLRFFTLGRVKVRRLPTPKPIYAKRPRVGKWPPLLFLLLTLLIAYATLSHASPPRSRGARPIALGNGYSAVAGDAYGLFYNPGGLAELNQQEFVMDYGRSASANEGARTDFNGIYAMPYRWKDQYMPIAIGFYGEQAAPGAHIIDITAGAGSDAPVDRWTKGIIKFPVRVGGAVTIRHQNGDNRSPRVGKSAIGLGLTGGAFIPIDKKHQAGVVIRNLFLGDANPPGASISAGIQRHHRDFLDMFADLEYSKGGTWRFKPGLEWLFARGVLRPRLGWGFRDNGQVDSVATGIGFYVSPMQIDISYLIPTKTLTDDMNQFRASFTYRFGRPQFSEIYYDRALEAASALDQKVLGMTVKEAELKASLSELEQKRRMAREELDNMKGRIESLKEQDLLGQRDAKIRALNSRIGDLEGQLSGSRGQVRALTEKRDTIRTHLVKAGDTLQSLAREYYGDPNQWKKIYNANVDKIERGLPKPGSKLVIP
jgi:hypothetical protein